MRKNKQLGFTLTDILILLIILGILIAIIISKYINLRNPTIETTKSAINGAVKSAFVIAIADKSKYPTVKDLAGYVTSNSPVKPVNKGIQANISDEDYTVQTYKDVNCEDLTTKITDEVRCVGSIAKSDNEQSSQSSNTEPKNPSHTAQRNLTERIKQTIKDTAEKLTQNVDLQKVGTIAQELGKEVALNTLGVLVGEAAPIIIGTVFDAASNLFSAAAPAVVAHAADAAPAMAEHIADAAGAVVNHRTWTKLGMNFQDWNILPNETQNMLKTLLKGIEPTIELKNRLKDLAAEALRRQIIP